MLVSAAPIPADGLVVARIPEPVDSPLASVDVKVPVLKFRDTPIAPLDNEARAEISVVENRTPEPEHQPSPATVETPEVNERGCGRWACF